MASIANIPSLMETRTLSILLLSLLCQVPLSLPKTTDTLNQLSSLSVEKYSTDVLVSKNRVFTAGFFPVGKNSFCFVVRFVESSVVWTANRDHPANGRGTKLVLTKKGNLVLFDTGRVSLWSTETSSNTSSVRLKLQNSGNLVLSASEKGPILWESFESPTDTLLPGQTLTMFTELVSSKSRTNYSSGYYKLYFDDDNTLRAKYEGPYPEISSVYWPFPWAATFGNGRSTYNNSKTAALNSSGGFISSDELSFVGIDYGTRVHRRLTLDPDGNLRMYSLNEKTRVWVVTWQAYQEPCWVHGICGPYSFCSYSRTSGRRCSCAPGYKMKKRSDWFFGCEPDFASRGNDHKLSDRFIRVSSAEFYGYDRSYMPNTTLKACKETCLATPECNGFQHSYRPSEGIFVCYPKTLLVNGHRADGFLADVYIRVPKNYKNKNTTTYPYYCAPNQPTLMLPFLPITNRRNNSVAVLLRVAVGFAALEILCVAAVIIRLYLSRSGRSERTTRGYIRAAAMFEEFSYAELRRATRKFADEIGRGSGGTVFKGVLADGRVAAVKRLTEANQGEAEFLAEVSVIGRLNHMNLIEMWGYCAEGRHRMLVYEYMENGSLADALASSNASLEWRERFEVAVGTARGLAYLHEECLEWVLHCDVKPQNILLNSEYHPKVADFGLSKLQSRGETHESSFSRIRGTRGYMAPEWVYNLPITSKVDVYSYGIVALELVTGRRPTGAQTLDVRDPSEQGRLVTWVRERKRESPDWIMDIADPKLEGRFEAERMEILVEVALQCVEEDRENRPSMRQVVEILHSRENI